MISMLVLFVQTRSLPGFQNCFLPVLSITLCRVSGLNVVEVAHDNSTSVISYVVKDLKLRNSYDTWHGEYNL